MIPQYLLLPIVLVPALMNGFANDELLAEDLKLKRNHPRFPFPVKVDIGEGETEGLPDRVQNQHSRMWYRLVPKGTYKIGSNKLSDSKEIQVRLSPYYISETCVSDAQVSKYLLEALNEVPEGKELKKLTEAIRRLPKAQQADFQLFFEMTNLKYLRIFWREMLDLDSSLNKEYELAFDSVCQEKQNENMTEDEILKNFELADKQRETFKKVMTALTRKLSKQEKNEDPYDRACSANASMYAEFRGVDLPTEAQWEVAARLSTTGNLKVENMIGDHREWCSDFYAYDYFKRKSHFDDPIGPRRSKLSEQQLENEVPVSGLKIITRIVALNLGVLRGESVSKRQYATLHSSYPANSKQPRRIRLVINLKKEKE